MMDSDIKHPSIKSVGWALVQASRLHRSRTGDKLSELGLFAGQEQVLQAFRRAEERVRPATPAYATVGDEFQAVFRSSAQAIRSTTSSWK